MELQELIIRFGLKVDDKALSNLNKIEAGFKGLSDVVTDIGKKFTGDQGIWDFFTGSIDKANELRKMAAATGISEKSLQKWSIAAEAAGANSQTILGDLRSLKNEYRYSEQAVQKLLASMAKMSGTQRAIMLRNYGLSDDFAMMAERYADAEKAFRESSGVLSGEEIDKATRAKTAIDNLKGSIQRLSEKVAIGASPKIKEFTEWLNNLQKNHPEETINAITYALYGLTGATVIAGLGAIAKGFANIVVGTKAFASVLTGLAAHPAILTLLSLPIVIDEVWTALKNVKHWWNDEELEESFTSRGIKAVLGNGGDVIKTLSELYNADVKKNEVSPSDFASEVLNQVKPKLPATMQPEYAFAQQNSSQQNTFGNVMPQNPVYNNITGNTWNIYNSNDFDTSGLGAFGKAIVGETPNGFIMK